MLQTLHDVGLDYIKLGQPSPTLSGGEAQRIKLARELVKRSTGRTLYILDEPTTGLHFDDIQQAAEGAPRVRGAGQHGAWSIEHNLDVIKTADWVIDLGPEGGDGGGLVVADGTPEEVAKVPASYTGVALDTGPSRPTPSARSARRRRLAATAARARGGSRRRRASTRSSSAGRGSTISRGSTSTSPATG